MSLVITGATIIDGVADAPLKGHRIWIEGDRIKAIVRDGEWEKPETPVTVIEARGKYIIPGLLNANVHLSDMRTETLVRDEDRYEDLILEGAQLALKNGVTTVFDTLGPRKPLMAARDKISQRQAPGSRIFCAGAIVGMDGPFSADQNNLAASVLSAAVTERINAVFVENVGPALSWMTPEQIAEEVQTYIEKGVDFIKYLGSEHRWPDPSAFLAFSPEAQSAIVEQAHRAGLTAQAHTTAGEALRVAVEAGCDLIQHCNITGPVPIPDSTLELMAKRQTGAVIFPFTQRRFDWIMKSTIDRGYWSTSDVNARALIRSGALILLATDGCHFAPEMATDPLWAKYWLAPGEDNLNDFTQGHFTWLQAMEEKGYPAMELLRAATINIAKAYKKDGDLGTLEAGKLADLLILDKDPLQSSANYRGIYMMLKDGVVVNRESLPQNPIYSKPRTGPSPETIAYRSQRQKGNYPSPS